MNFIIYFTHFFVTTLWTVQYTLREDSKQYTSPPPPPLKRKLDC